MPPFDAFHLPIPGRGQRFGLYHPPADGPARGAILYLAPFAEEMNKARRMAALQSRAFARAGFAVLQVDLLGCGDSDGDFGDADWQAWVDDALQAAAWLRARVPAPLTLWGLRAGCLLASAAARRLDAPCDLVFWQPTPSGKTVLQQFLRLKLAGSLLSGEARATTQSLRERLRAGEPQEIAGYVLSPALADGLEQATLQPPTRPARLDWFELASSADDGLSPAFEAVHAGWSAAAHAVRGHVSVGPLFWQTSEIEEAPALIEATLRRGHVARRLADAGDGMTTPERPLVFDCAGETLLGVLSVPETGAADVGVVIVVGGPQYRAGSHRQFVLSARALAAGGVPVLRFDIRGMGDSTGAARSFEDVSDDIGAAIDALQRALPSVRRVVLSGLCDGASAALMYRQQTRDPRVVGFSLMNPWVRSEAGQVRAQVTHYYVQRLRERAFWMKLLSGKVARAALTEAVGKVGAVLRQSRRPVDAVPAAPTTFQQRMARAWQDAPLPLLLVLSGRDLTATEFVQHAAAEPDWAGALTGAHVLRHDIPDADHTLSLAAHREQADRLALAWLHGVTSPRPADALTS